MELSGHSRPAKAYLSGRREALSDGALSQVRRGGVSPITSRHDEVTRPAITAVNALPSHYLAFAIHHDFDWIV